MPMSHAAEIEGYILDGMARAIWVHAYMAWALEVDPPPEFPPGATWDEVAPEDDDIQRGSRQAAKDLADLISEANRLGSHPMAKMFLTSGVRPGRGTSTRATEADAAFAFGENLALVCIGSRERTPLLGTARLPRFSATLDDDGHSLQWEGDMERAAVVNPARKIEILVLEDEPRLQAGITRMLRQIFGDAPAITVVDNVGAAIGYLECHTYALIVSDVNVCGRRTGIDLFWHVQAEHPEMVDKFVFFTDNLDAEQLHYRYLQKPATAQDLRRVLHAPRPGAPATRAVSAHRESQPAPAREYSHEDRARVVLEVAPTIRTERNAEGRTAHRFGDKVFISAIWPLVRDRPEFAGWSLDQFKQWLVTANRMRLLNLARADLVGAMVASEVQASEINHMGASFHFVDVTGV